MTPLEIQFELRRRGITQKAIAAELGVSDFHVGEVIRKRRVSDRVMRTVSATIGKDHREVFPEYYLESKPRPIVRVINNPKD